MQCPHCEHEDGGYDFEQQMVKKGEPFYRHPVEMVQSSDYDEGRKILYGCPECSKTFIGPTW